MTPPSQNTTPSFDHPKRTWFETTVLVTVLLLVVAALSTVKAASPDDGTQPLCVPLTYTGTQ